MTLTRDPPPIGADQIIPVETEPTIEGFRSIIQALQSRQQGTLKQNLILTLLKVDAEPEQEQFPGRVVI
jgi:hypothetical protein